VQVRLICGGTLPIKPADILTGAFDSEFTRSKFSCGVSKKNVKKKVDAAIAIDTLIIHIHGGGFCSQSSFSH